MQLPHFLYRSHDKQPEKKNKMWLPVPVLVLIVLVSGDAFATADTDPSAHFHGTLNVVECHINNDTKQTVDFGDAVGIHRINGKRYEQPVPFTVDCKNYAGGDVPALTLKLEGTATSFNDAAVATNVSGLGIELRNNGTAQPLNKTVTFDYQSIPVITAVPVKDPSTDLSAQTFTATVKLTVEMV